MYNLFCFECLAQQSGNIGSNPGMGSVHAVILGLTCFRKHFLKLILFNFYLSRQDEGYYVKQKSPCRQASCLANIGNVDRSAADFKH